MIEKITLIMVNNYFTKATEDKRLFKEKTNQEQILKCNICTTSCNRMQARCSVRCAVYGIRKLPGGCTLTILYIIFLLFKNIYGSVRKSDKRPEHFVLFYFI